MFFGKSMTTGPRPAALGDIERFRHDARDVVDVRDEIAVLHDRHGHADDVRLLKRTATDHVLVHLTGDGHQRAGVEISVGDGGNEIRCARAGGAHAHAGFAGGAGITFRGEAAALFMAGEDRADLGLRERLMDLHARAARIGEDRFHASALEGFDKNVAAQHQRADFGALLRWRFCGGLLRFRCGAFAHTDFSGLFTAGGRG